MTRHNLDSHLSWLLSQPVIPQTELPSPIPNQRVATATRDISVEAEGDEVALDTQPEVALDSRQGIVRTVNEEIFRRPPLPSNPTFQPPFSGTSSLLQKSMGKLSSASRSARPDLLSQQQLATPASSTNSTNSTLKHNYAAFLLGDGGTPTAKPRVERTPSSHLKPVSAPRTPRQTPRQTPRPTSGLVLDTIEPVDLTDDTVENPTSRSSSTTPFGNTTVLWTPGAASRPEPLETSQSPAWRGKKRKSNEISSRSIQKRTRPERQLEEVYQGDLDDFMDIDDMFAIRSQHSQTPLKKRPVRQAQPNKDVDPANDFEEEDFQVTETIRRVETRTRKSISRVPSLSEASSNSRRESPRRLPLVGLKDGPDTAISKKRTPELLVARSPSSKLQREQVNGLHKTPQKSNKCNRERVIQDSDEDDNFSIDLQASCTSRSPSKGNPKVVISRRSPKWDGIPPWEASGTAMNSPHMRRQPLGSPLKPISCNLGSRQDSIPSPLDGVPPTKITPSSNANPFSSQPPPSSPSRNDADKRALALFLKQPSAIASYQLRVRNLKQQSADACMDYLDRLEPPPHELQEERRLLVVKDAAYSVLESLRDNHAKLNLEKKRLAKLISDAPEGADTTSDDESIAMIVQEIVKIGREIIRQLHLSGAVEDGFGTGSNMGDTSSIPICPSKGTGSGSLIQGSGIVGSAQVVFQTQVPSVKQYSITTADRPLRGSPMETVAQPFELQHHPVAPDRSSPSPVRNATYRSNFVRDPIYSETNDIWATSGTVSRRPNFVRDRFTDDNIETAYDDTILDEFENDVPSKQIGNTTEAVAMSEDEFWEQGDDSAMLEVAQQVEHRHSISFGAPRSISPAPHRASKRTYAGTETDMYALMSVDAARAGGLLRNKFSEDIVKVLKDRFRLTGFRHNQLNAMNATLLGQDVFVLMPTGGGKSLCYQLPAIVQSGKTKGITVVISPLLSLMTDQVDHLRKINVRAATLNGEVSRQDRAEIMHHLRETHPEQYLQLLYITPEMANKSDALMDALSTVHKNRKLARIVIDEAHCVSQWGHDFRPDYVALGHVRAKFPGVPIMALTATATSNVQLDVETNLKMVNPKKFTQSFNRPNLYYEVRKKKGKGSSKAVLEDMAKLIKSKYRNQSGIIYSLSRKGCEQLAEELRKEHKLDTAHFHADMPTDEKAAVQRNWQSGAIQVVVATIAFGMGIDKRDVRFIIHHTVPKTLEGYYQETGRAGRDGAPSGCYLYYGFQDTAILRDFIKNSEGNDDQKERQYLMLRNMVQYCENRSDCRRVEVLRYFNEMNFNKDGCHGMCDNCKSDAVFETVDFTTQAQHAVELVKKLQDENVTLIHCIDILQGKSSPKIKKMAHESLDEYGIASSIARGEVERIFYRLVMDNALVEYSVTNKVGFATQYVKLGRRYKAFLEGRQKVKLQVIVSSSPAALQKQRATKSPKKAAKVTKTTTQTFSSTILTSPLAPRMRRPANRALPVSDIEDREHFRAPSVTSDDEDDDDGAFEPLSDRGAMRGPGNYLGPRISSDKILTSLSPCHQDMIYQFVDRAKTAMEKLKNDKGFKKSIFTESNIRDMALSRTVTLESMNNLPGINQESVKNWGSRLIPMIKVYCDFVDTMNEENNTGSKTKTRGESVNGTLRNNDRATSKDQPVLILSSDEEESGIDENDPHILPDRDERSKHFPDGRSKKGGRALPWADGASAASKQSGRGFPFKGKKRGGRKNSGGRRSASASGHSNAGVAKRLSSGSSKRGGGSKAASRAAASTTSGQSNLMKSFGNQGGRSGGGIGGIGMMPA